MINEESIRFKKNATFALPIVMLAVNSLVTVKYDVESAFTYVLSYFLGYFTFLGFFVMVVIVLLNQHKLLEFQKTYIDIAFALGILNIFVGLGTYIIVNIIK